MPRRPGTCGLLTRRAERVEAAGDREDVSERGDQQVHVAPEEAT
jgi:hypothetical protein